MARHSRALLLQCLDPGAQIFESRSLPLAEARLPFDIVFLINRFLGAASQAVIDAGGQPNQYVGDGMLALFGLSVDPATACRQAMSAAANVAANVEYMNHQFAAELREPIQFGIGIHAAVKPSSATSGFAITRCSLRSATR